MWCLFSIILHGMTAVCYPWFFAVGCRSAASMVEWHDVRQGRGNRVYTAKVCRGLQRWWQGMVCGWCGRAIRLILHSGFAGMLRLKRGFEDR